MDFQAVGWENMYWIFLVLDRAVLNAAMKLRFTYKAGEDLLASPKDSAPWSYIGVNVLHTIRYL